MLRAVPIYAMLAENLPIWARKEIDAICRKFFWAGSDQSIRGKCMVAWPEVCRPTQLGGLGISDLKLTSYALQTKWLWLQQTDQDRAWSQLPIQTTPQVQAFFRASTFTAIGDGRTTLFWEDRWINGKSVSQLTPCIYHLVLRRVRRRQTVQDGLQNRNWARSISGGMSLQAILDYLQLWNAVATVQLNDQPESFGDGQQTENTQPNQHTSCCIQVPPRCLATN